MKIGIVTQSLKDNYGGVLQNYALQQTLKRLGHEPVTIDYMPRVSFLRFLLSSIKSTILYFIPGKRRHFAPVPKKDLRNYPTMIFVSRYISRTKEVFFYSPILIKQYHLDGIIVGSDQVWRPESALYDMFCRFVKEQGKKRIVYAASFGVDNWLFTDEQTKECRKLAKRLDAISVREDSGVILCKNFLGVNAVEVLDPTMLLSVEDYYQLCHNISVRENPFLAAYILDVSEEKMDMINRLAQENNLSVEVYSAGKAGVLTIEEWLAIFRDAEFIVTDSFHGTVFSIINQKPFLALSNSKRGNTRFDSLLGKFNLKSRLIAEDFDCSKVDKIDWDEVSRLHDVWKRKSIDFLTKALDKS